MKEIDDMLNKWIFNSIVRKKLRKIITKTIQNSYDKGWIDSRF